MLNDKQPLLRVRQSQFFRLMTVGSDFNPLCPPVGYIID
jgi:hypothetical protein